EDVRRSTKQTNKRIAEQIEAAQKTSLAKGEVGIVEREPAPTLKQFSGRFMHAVSIRCAEKPRTVEFYREKLNRLLEYPAMASAALDAIDEALIEEYVQQRRKLVAPATVNRQLATLRRALRLAHEWKVIDRLPRIRLLQGERTREFVLSRDQEPVYLNATPEPLKDLALLMLDTGLRDGEALALKWPDLHLKPAPTAKFGYLQVWKGKSAKARRTVSLTARVREMLTGRSKESSSEFVFPGRGGNPILVTSLDHQHAKVRDLLKMPEDFVVHSLRHTMLTRLGLLGVDAFTIMKIAGHSSITVSQRYVHPSPESVESAFEKLEMSNQPVPRKKVGIELGIAAKNAVRRNRRNSMK
ncbi:MAG: site-specific integrase, partial [Bryobacteraceae bacterium]